MTTESYIIHAYKPIPDDQLKAIAQVLKTEAIIKDGTVPFGLEESTHPHIYTFHMDALARRMKLKQND